LPPSDVDFLSDFSESEGEESEAGEHSEKKKKKAIAWRTDQNYFMIIFDTRKELRMFSN